MDKLTPANLAGRDQTIDRLREIPYLNPMSKREIVLLPDPVLRQVCQPIEIVDDEIRQLADDMLETMYDAPGIGLAAIQIAVAKRMLVLDVAKEEEPENPMVFINPKIVWQSEDTSVYQEGCLSIPEFFEDVERPTSIGVTFQDRDGEKREIEADGLLATCLQHEIDHLDGVLFIDHISKLKRDRVVKKFTKQAKMAAKA